MPVRERARGVCVASTQSSLSFGCTVNAWCSDTAHQNNKLRAKYVVVVQAPRRVAGQGRLQHVCERACLRSVNTHGCSTDTWHFHSEGSWRALQTPVLVTLAADRTPLGWHVVSDPRQQHRRTSPQQEASATAAVLSATRRQGPPRKPTTSLHAYTAVSPVRHVALSSLARQNS